MSRTNKCPHLDIVLQLTLPEIYKVKQGLPCTQCDTSGHNLWICLYKNCKHIGCSEDVNDHSTKHYRSNQTHCLHMNLSTQRTWCYICKMEVFVANAKRRASLLGNESSRYTEKIHAYDRNAESGESSGGDEDEGSGDRRNYGSGLIGLQNIANTCYMNAALQALSNTPPLTRYFLECGSVIEATNALVTAQQQQHHPHHQTYQQSSQRKAGLARSYHRLVNDMWCRSKRSNGYVVPSGILNGIRNVHPMFRGYQQHDTQEFLRCFMDQLHEELKEQTPPPPDILLKHNTGKYLKYKDNMAVLFSNNMQKRRSPHLQHQQAEDGDDETDRSQCSSPSSSRSQSEAEYETCESGASEQSSLSDEASSNVTTAPATAATYMSLRSTRRPSSVSSPPHQRHNSNLTKSSSAGNRFVTGGASGTDEATAAKSTISSDAIKQPPHRSIISDVFDGKLLSSVQCLTCDRVSTREETFQDLSLPIPGKDHLTVLHQNQGLSASQQSTHMVSGSPSPPQLMPVLQQGINCTDSVYQATPEGWLWWFVTWVRSFFWGPAVSLHDCMAAFFSADELKGDNMYSCEKCKKLRNGMKFSRVLALPEMLCVHLKRFRHDLSYSSKIASPVHFPMRGLDMSSFLHKDFNSAISTYDLTAVICHHGTVGGGHYTSYARHEMKGKWYEYDDQLVTEVSEEDVQRCEAYVLFYRKVNPEMSVIRARAMQILDACADAASSASADIRFFVSKQWLNKFYTFAEPGPIDNWALLCPHGALPPNKAPIKSQLVVALPQPLWDYMYRQFGGGPACNHLYECDVCRRAAEELSQRQTVELEAFQRYKDETTSTIYAIAMAWLRQWQLFVGGGSANDDPGPISNAAIAGHVADGNEPIRSVRSGSDYAQINSSLWRFFYGVYGGGPVIVLRGSPEEIPLLSTGPTVVEQQPCEPRIADAIVEQPNPSLRHTVAVVPAVAVADAPSPPPPIVEKRAKKVVKNVSFEDDGELLESSSISSTVSSTTTAATDNIVVGSRSSKYTRTPATTINEIVSKKDKRHRGGITTNGLFGPEGKYSDNSLFSQQSNCGGGGSLSPSPPLSKNTSTTIITKALHPKSVTVGVSDGDVSGIINDAEQQPMTDAASGSGGRKAHKSRKKIKIKSAKKQATLHYHNSHHNNNNNNNNSNHHPSESDRSDSDR